MCFCTHNFACKRLHSGENACTACIACTWLRTPRRIKTVLAVAGSGKVPGKMLWGFGALRGRGGEFRRLGTWAFFRNNRDITRQGKLDDCVGVLAQVNSSK